MDEQPEIGRGLMHIAVSDVADNEGFLLVHVKMPVGSDSKISGAAVASIQGLVEKMGGELRGITVVTKDHLVPAAQQTPASKDEAEEK